MSDVINLDQVRKNKELLKRSPIDPFSKIATDEDVAQEMGADEEATFKALEKRNKDNAERIRKERLAANQSVLRSHRIKQ